MSNLKRGDQVICTPPHIKPDDGLCYPNGRQAGFITSGPCRSSMNGLIDAYFVRYWRIEDGQIKNVLRTWANSERTPIAYLTQIDTVPTEWVEKALKDLC